MVIELGSRAQMSSEIYCTESQGIPERRRLSVGRGSMQYGRRRRRRRGKKVKLEKDKLLYLLD